MNVIIRSLKHCLSIACLTASITTAQNQDDAGDISNFARHYLYNAIKQNLGQGDYRLEVSAVGIDPRLRLPACSQKLAAKPPENLSHWGRQTLNVYCPDAGSWSLYVPLSVKLFKPAITMAAVIPRGHVLAKEDVLLRELDLGKHPYAVQDIDKLIGRVSKRSLPNGHVVRLKDFAKALLVRSGDKVSIEYHKHSINVRSFGTALGRGASGDFIKVRNSSSGRVIVARVTALRAVTVGD